MTSDEITEYIKTRRNGSYLRLMSYLPRIVDSHCGKVTGDHGSPGPIGNRSAGCQPAPREFSFALRVDGRIEVSRRGARSVYTVAGDVDGVDCPRVPDVLKRIAIEHDQIGPPARLECAEFFRAQELRRAPGCRDDDLHWRQAGLRHQFHLPLLEVAGKAAGRPGVGAEPVSDSGIGQQLQISFCGIEETADIRRNEGRMRWISGTPDS